MFLPRIPHGCGQQGVHTWSQDVIRRCLESLKTMRRRGEELQGYTPVVVRKAQVKMRTELSLPSPQLPMDEMHLPASVPPYVYEPLGDQATLREAGEFYRCIGDSILTSICD